MLSKEPNLLSQDNNLYMSLGRGKGIRRYNQAAITSKKISLARPKGNPGYLSNSVSPSTAFLFSVQQVFMQEAWKFFSSRTKFLYKETAQQQAL